MHELVADHEQEVLEVLSLVTDAKAVKMRRPCAHVASLPLQDMADGHQHTRAVTVMHSCCKHAVTLQAGRGSHKSVHT